MEELIPCTVVGQMYTNDSVKTFSSYSAYAGKSGNYYYTYALKFEIPEFEGKPELLNFSIILTSSYSGGHTLRGAVVDSLDNFSSYVTSRAPTGEVADTHQVGSNILTFDGVDNVRKPFTIDIPLSKTIQAGTYYLILWAYTAVGFTVNDISNGYGTTTATLQINTNVGPVAYVRRNGQWVQAGVYIRRNGAFVPATIHI